MGDFGNFLNGFAKSPRFMTIDPPEHWLSAICLEKLDHTDSNLTYNEHIVSTVSSCMSRLGQINRVKHIFNKHALIIIINALVFSKLFYCSSVWSNTTQTNLDKLQAVQNFACRILSGAKKFDHITPLLKDLRWLPIRQQLYFRFAVLVFKSF